MKSFAIFLLAALAAVAAQAAPTSASGAKKMAPFISVMAVRCDSVVLGTNAVVSESYQVGKMYPMDGKSFEIYQANDKGLLTGSATYYGTHLRIVTRFVPAHKVGVIPQAVGGTATVTTTDASLQDFGTCQQPQDVGNYVVEVGVLPHPGTSK